MQGFIVKQGGRHRQQVNGQTSELRSQARKARPVRAAIYGLLVLATYCLLPGPLGFAQGFDTYGGTLNMACGANPRLIASSISSFSGSGTSITVTVSSAASFNLYDAVYFTGTGTALDYPFPGGTGYSGLSNGNVLPAITAISGNRLTVAVPSGTYSASAGTLAKAVFYTSKLSSRWWFCTPLGNAIFLNGVFGVGYEGSAGSSASFDNVINYNLVNGKYKVGPYGSGNQACNWGYRNALRLKSWGFNYLDIQPSTYVAPWQVNACYGGDSSIPVEARIAGVVQTQVSLYASVNRFQGSSNNLPVAPGLVKNLIDTTKYSVIGYPYIKGMVDTADANFAQYPAGNMLTAGTRGNAGIVNPHHEYVAMIAGDESDEMGGQNIANTPAQAGSEGTCGTSAWWCVAKATSSVGAGTVAYQDPISTGQEDLRYDYFVLVSSPSVTGIAKGSNNLKGYDTNDHLAANQVTGLSGTLAGGTVTLTNVIGARVFNGQPVWITAASAGDWVGGPFTATGTQVGYANGTVTFACGGCTRASATGVTLFAPNFKLWLKYDLANWLQGLADAQTGVSLTRTGGGTVVATFNGQQPFTAHDVLTISNCSGFNTTSGSPVTVTAFTSTDPALHAPGTTNTVTFTQPGSNTTSTGCTVGAGPGYTLAALNAAWGSSYDTFGSDAVSHTTALASSDNLTWTGTLTTPVTPMSVYITAGSSNVPVAGDDGSGPRKPRATKGGNFRSGVNNSDTTLTSTKSASCNSSPSNVICYDTGAVRLTFRSGQSNVKATYQTGGWGSGSGLLDEDGTCPSKRSSTCWLPKGTSTTGDYLLTPGFGSGLPTASFITDMNNYYFRLMKLYCRGIASAYRATAPGVLLENFATNGPTFPWTYWAIGQYFDVQGPMFPLDDSTSTGGQGSAVTDNQARIDFAAANLGDLPWAWQEEFTSWNDSYFATQPNQPSSTSTLDFDTEAHKGAYYATHTTALLKAQVSSNCTTFVASCSLAGTYLVANRSWYAYIDAVNNNPGGTSSAWGIVDIRDDPYDGKASTPNASTEGVYGYAYSLGCQGSDAKPGTPVLLPCEPRASGDFIDYVRDANAYWLKYAVRTGRSAEHEGHSVAGSARQGPGALRSDQTASVRPSHR